MSGTCLQKTQKLSTLPNVGPLPHFNNASLESLVESLDELHTHLKKHPFSWMLEESYETALL